MATESVAILGVPVDNLTMDEAVEQIFSMVEGYRTDGRPRLVATVNVDFLVNTLTWRLGRIRHPELMDVLRRADLVTADGMPLVLVSRLLGCPLKERVTGADLVPALAAEAAGRGKSIYFLGGRGDVAERAAAVLQRQYPELVIAGIDAPFVHVEGEELGNAAKADREIVGRINDAKPDILLIAFGNPKQEVWFNRNRTRLRVPVSIGVGGTFEFITGSVRRAPAWMQKTGLEWVFRITQDPGRLWKRYFVGFFKFGLMVWPAALHYRYKRLCHRLFRQGGAGPAAHSGQGFAEGTQINIVTLPGRLDAGALEGLAASAEEILSGSSDIVLDFTGVSFIDSRGLGFLIRTFRRVEGEGRTVYFVGVTPKVRSFFELNRTWDLFRKGARERIEEVLTYAKAEQGRAPFRYFVTRREDLTILDLFGRLDAQQMAGLDMAELKRAVAGTDCILNLGQLHFVDSSGLALFFKIQRYLSGLGRQCVLCSMNDGVDKLFSLTRLHGLFRSAPDFKAAERMLEKTP
jgi:N-acetylglucosaminyldiphosphoundecaprenol N-acetyl-beta-D-mannosaminyltransferase